MKDTTGCLYRETGDPKSCLNCPLSECVEGKETDWKDEFAKQNRPDCPSCGRPMKRMGQHLYKSGAFRTFTYKCARCDKYARITTQEEGYHEPSELPWETKFHNDNRPWCCGRPMAKAGVRKWEATGAYSFTYRCSTCRQQKTVKTYEDKHFPDNPTLKALDPTRIDELIRSTIADEDGIQDAWLAVLEQGATTEDEVLAIARKTLSRVRHQIISRSHTDMSLSELDTDDKPQEVSPDRFAVLGVESSISLEEARDTEPVRCPHCRSHNTLVMIGSHTDKKGTRRKFLCRACWRPTLWPRRHPYRQQGKVHVHDVDEGAEIDLSSVSRRAVAEKVHCHPTTVSQILCGRTTASLPLFYDIAKACGCTMDELFKTISGANGKNPARLKYKREPSSWCDREPLPPKYTVNGKGYPNLREALLSLGIERRMPTHYNALPPEIQAQITRNRPFRGR